MKLVFLSNLFYQKYQDCPEVLKKDKRPYICITVEVDNNRYAIPIRHHISHKHAFITIENRGLDYTKAVLIDDDSFIAGEIPVIDTVEWRKIQINERKIYVGFCRYLKEYKHALSHKDKLRNDNIIKYSALQYFDL